MIVDIPLEFCEESKWKMDPSAEEVLSLIKLLQKFYEYQLEPFIECINQSSRSSNMISLKCLKNGIIGDPSKPNKLACNSTDELNISNSMDFSVNNQNVTIRHVDVWLWSTSLSVCLWQTKSDGGDVGIWLQRNSMNRLNGFGIMPMKGSVYVVASIERKFYS